VSIFHRFALLFACLSSILVSESAIAELRFTEISVRTTGTDVRYVELTNITSVSQELGGLILSNRPPGSSENGRRFAPRIELAPHQSITIAESASVYLRHFGFRPNFVFDAGSSTDPTWTMLDATPHNDDIDDVTLDRDGGALYLSRPDGEVIDAISWGQNTEVYNPPLLPLDRDDVGHRSQPLRSPEISWHVDQSPTPEELPPFACSSSECGDGIKTPDEQCDDGNRENGDGCDGGCLYEVGFDCYQADPDCVARDVPATNCVSTSDSGANSIEVSEVAFFNDPVSCGAWIEVTSNTSAPISFGSIQLADYRLRTRFGPGHTFNPGDTAVVATQYQEVSRESSPGPTWSCLGSGSTFYEDVEQELPTSYRLFEMFNSNDAIPSAFYAQVGFQPKILLSLDSDRLTLGVLNDEGEQVINRNVDGVIWGGPRVPDLSTQLWSGRRLPDIRNLVLSGFAERISFARRDEVSGGARNSAEGWTLTRCPSPGETEAYNTPYVPPETTSVSLIADGQRRRYSLKDIGNAEEWWVTANSEPSVVSQDAGSPHRLVISPSASSGQEADVTYWVVEECQIHGPFDVQFELLDPVLCFPDEDGDGVGQSGVSPVQRAGSCRADEATITGDCNDGNAAVFPGAEEVCDGFDNDCDPSTTDGVANEAVGTSCDGDDADACAEGTTLCIDGEIRCLETTFPKRELCDGIDNDCRPETPDGSDEPALGDACDGDDSDLCAQGVVACEDGVLTCSEPGPVERELCDGIDNDCNPLTPDGFDEEAYQANCSTGIGACSAPGQILCDSGTLGCSASPMSPLDEEDATCDGVDDDCDGETDEDFVGESVTCGTGECRTSGEELCDSGDIIAECEPREGQTESAASGNCDDQLDNDCDGQADTDPECSVEIPCFVDLDGDGHAGYAVEVESQAACDAAGGEAEDADCLEDDTDPCAVVTWLGASEGCDGCDNDCDGEVDEEFPDLGRECTSPDDDSCRGSYVCSADNGSVVCELEDPACPTYDGPDTPCEQTDTCDQDPVGDRLSFSGGGGCRIQRADPTNAPLLLVIACLLGLSRRRGKR
jgi:cysteine-rich repeat protein